MFETRKPNHRHEPERRIAAITIDSILKAGPRSLCFVLLGPGLASCASAPPIAAEVSAAPSVQAEVGEVEDDASQRTRLTLPFDGTWIVGQGYHGSESHQGYAAYALDLVRLGDDGRAYVGQGKRTKDWYGFGAEVLATADGVVVRANDEFPDNRVLGQATNTNSLIIRHGPAEFSEYVHLQHRSLQVGVGESVKRDQILARCGNAGSATPHLHWAMLSSIEPIQTRFAVFSDYEVRDEQGAWHPGRGTPRAREMIRPRSNAATPEIQHRAD